MPSQLKSCFTVSLARSDQYCTQATTASRTAAATQLLSRHPQALFLGGDAPPAVRPGLHSWTATSLPDWPLAASVVPPGRLSGVRTRPLRPRTTAFARYRTPPAAIGIRHTDPIPAHAPAGAAAGWPSSVPLKTVVVSWLSSSFPRSSILLS